MKLYKLTDKDGFTRNGTKWSPGVTHTAQAEGNELDSDQVIHAYPSPEMAAIMNPVHANIVDPILWESEGDVVVSDGTRVGCKSLTTIRRIMLPEITTKQIVRFAILTGSLSEADAAETSERNQLARSLNAVAYAASVKAFDKIDLTALAQK